MGKVIRIILIIAIASMAWEEYQSVSTTLTNNTLKEFSIAAVEESGIGDTRYVQLTNATEEGQYVYITDQKTKQVTSVFYLVSTSEKVNAATDENPINPMVMIKRNLNDDKHKNCTLENDFCIDFKPKNYQGAAYVGEDEITRSMSHRTRGFIKDSGIELDNMVLLAEDVDPNSEYLDIFGFLVGLILVIIFIGWSFTWEE